MMLDQIELFILRPSASEAIKDEEEEDEEDDEEEEPSVSLKLVSNLDCFATAITARVW